MAAARAAINAGDLDLAGRHLEKAYTLILKTRLPKSLNLNLTLVLCLAGDEFTKLGRADLADGSSKMSRLLQSRFDVGDYYIEPS